MATPKQFLDKASSFSGNWNSAWTGGAQQPSVLSIKVDNLVGTGTYAYKNGKLNGQFSEGGVCFKGNWTQDDGAGTFTFVLLGNDLIAGSWGTSAGDLGGQWISTRKS